MWAVHMLDPVLHTAWGEERDRPCAVCIPIYAPNQPPETSTAGSTWSGPVHRVGPETHKPDCAALRTWIQSVSHVWHPCPWWPVFVTYLGFSKHITLAWKTKSSLKVGGATACPHLLENLFILGLNNSKVLSFTARYTGGGRVGRGSTNSLIF